MNAKLVCEGFDERRPRACFGSQFGEAFVYAEDDWPDLNPSVSESTGE
jgi:hypothetical protein